MYLAETKYILRIKYLILLEHKLFENWGLFTYSALCSGHLTQSLVDGWWSSKDLWDDRITLTTYSGSQNKKWLSELGNRWFWMQQMLNLIGPGLCHAFSILKTQCKVWRWSSVADTSILYSAFLKKITLLENYQNRERFGCDRNGMEAFIWMNFGSLWSRW